VTELVERLGSSNDTAYGEEWSARWERDFGTRPDTDDAVACVSELAAGRAVLELGVGTGRLALRLQERGLAVEGVDSSPWMLAQLRLKPGGDRLPVTEGDLVTCRLGRRFGLVLLASYTISALTTQDLQVACFENAARHLEPGGLFVVEAMVPSSESMATGASRTIKVADGEVVLHMSSPADPLGQTAEACHLYLRDGEPPRLRPLSSRYVWPSELDLMARIAGLERVHRWGGWDRQRFTARSQKHISVYRGT
jgi:SAM-dependent methyltransferase